MANLIGETLLNRYHVREFLGRGGMAEVYKVWDSQRMTFLAMKVLLDDLALDRVFVRRFTREAKTLERLQHTNIVRFFGFEKAGRDAFTLMDYIEGETLKHFIHDSNGKSMRFAHIREVTRSVCGALNYAHSQGFVHCDIKPANIMIDKHGKVLLADFGIARMSETATATMVGIGTPAYMAPEQAQGQEPVSQTDIYALGVVLYEMFTGGERPFTGKHAEVTGGIGERVRWEHVHLQPPSPRQWNSSISGEIEAVILRCLEKDPNDRYQTALDLFNALELAFGNLEGEAPFVVPGPVSDEDAGIPKDKTKAILPAGIAFAALLLLAVVWALVRKPAVIDTSIPVLENPTQSVLSPIPTERIEKVASATSSEVVKPSTSVPTATFTPTMPPAPTIRAFSPDQGTVAFATNRKGNKQVAVINADGTGLYYLPFPSGKNYCDEPDISPDGRMVAYECKNDSGTAWNIYTTSMNGSDLQNLGEGREPDWSPDGDLIAFETGYPLQIWTMDVSGRNPRQITFDKFDNRAPSWSPDGKYIAMMSNINDYWQIRILNISTGRFEQITNGNISKRFPVWSPDGSKIAYNTIPTMDIWIVDIDGDNVQQITSLRSAGRAAWSPDSQYLLFNALVDEDWRIRRINIDGSGLETVTPSGGHDEQPDWSW